MSTSRFKVFTLSLAILSCGFFFSTRAFAVFLLDDVMSRDEQRKTGVDKLTHTQKFELEVWLNENFDIKPSKVKKPVTTLTIDENIYGGNYLRLSDGSLYQVAPSDTIRSSMWLTPIPVQIKSSNDPNYPLMLVNQNTGDAILVKPISPYQKLTPPSSAPSPAPPPTTPPPAQKITP